MTDLLKELLVNQYIEGVYAGLLVANAKLEEYGIEIKTPTKEFIMNLYKETQGEK